MRRRPKLMVLLTVVTLLTAAGPALAGDADSKSPAPGNIVLKVTLTQGGPGAPSASKTYEVVAAAGEPVRLNVGMRYPFPATKVEPDKNIAPIVAFSYQNIGFIMDAVMKVAADGKITVDGTFESSQILETATARTGQPVIGTFNQTVHVRLTPGKPMQLHRVSETTDSTVSLTLVADLLP